MRTAREYDPLRWVPTLKDMDEHGTADLAAQLRHVERQLAEAWNRGSVWQTHIGPLRITKVMTSRVWFVLLLGIYLLAFGSGVALALIEKTEELGVALVRHLAVDDLGRCSIWKSPLDVSGPSSGVVAAERGWRISIGWERLSF
jgi:hypothetical protein